jgi:hypothetical protein
MLIYSDLDNTLIDPVVDENGDLVKIFPRPGVQSFLTKLGRDGQPWLLTAASLDHARRALEILKPGSKVFKGIISMEDMVPIQAQVDIIMSKPDLPMAEALNLWSQIKPIAPPGPVFDNLGIGSWAYFLKAAAVGISPKEWIQVEHYGDGHKDHNGLKKAYQDFRHRYPTLLFLGEEKMSPHGRMASLR